MYNLDSDDNYRNNISNSEGVDGKRSFTLDHHRKPAVCPVHDVHPNPLSTLCKSHKYLPHHQCFLMSNTIARSIK